MWNLFYKNNYNNPVYITMSNLPSELINYIYSYDPEHRIRLDEVHEELLYETNTYICDNDMCEEEFDIRHENSKTNIRISFMTCHFCSAYCESYGRWSVQYDLRKMNRH